MFKAVAVIDDPISSGIVNLSPPSQEFAIKLLDLAFNLGLKVFNQAVLKVDFGG